MTFYQTVSKKTAGRRSYSHVGSLLPTIFVRIPTEKNNNNIVVNFKQSVNQVILQKVAETSFTYTLNVSNLLVDEPYSYLNEDQLTLMAMAYSEKSLAEDWDIDDQEENDYWKSLLD